MKTKDIMKQKMSRKTIQGTDVKGAEFNYSKLIESLSRVQSIEYKYATHKKFERERCAGIITIIFYQEFVTNYFQR